jgi:hypothetical protein
VPVKAKYGSDSEYFDLDVSELAAYPEDTANHV